MYRVIFKSELAHSDLEGLDWTYVCPAKDIVNELGPIKDLDNRRVKAYVLSRISMSDSEKVFPNDFDLKVENGKVYMKITKKGFDRLSGGVARGSRLGKIPAKK